MSLSSSSPPPPSPLSAPPPSASPSLDVDGVQIAPQHSRHRADNGERSPSASHSLSSPSARRYRDASPSLDSRSHVDDPREPHTPHSHSHIAVVPDAAVHVHEVGIGEPIRVEVLAAAPQPSAISSPLHPPGAALPTYTLTPLRSRPPSGPVPSLHDAGLPSPPPSAQDEAGNTFPVQHPDAAFAASHNRTRPKRQNSVFAPLPSPPVPSPLTAASPAHPALAVQREPSSELRRWQTWEGKARFFFDGRLMAGPHWHKAAVTFFLVLVPAVLFLVFPAADLIDRLSVSVEIIGAVLTAVSLTFLLVTSTQDPGVIPRNRTPARGFDDDEGRPLTQEIMMDGRRVHVKYCSTCRIYRPPRAVHCSLCDACVERFDHHCPWLGTCIGRHNYRAFSIFLYSLTALLLWVMAFCVTDMVFITREKREDAASSSLDDAFAAMLRRNPIAFILTLYCWLASFFVVGLACFHLYLVSTNQTTNEQLKAAFPQGSPWSNGCLGNWADMCRAQRRVEGLHRRERVRARPPGASAVELISSPSMQGLARPLRPPPPMHSEPASGRLASPDKPSFDEHKHAAAPATTLSFPESPAVASSLSLVTAVRGGPSIPAHLNRHGFLAAIARSDPHEEKEIITHQTR